MSENYPPLPEAIKRDHVENLTDFVYGASDDNPVEVDVAVDDQGKVVVFHSHVFKDDIGWFECDLDAKTLMFIFDDGRSTNSGIKVSDMMIKYIQNSHQLLTVLLDQETGEAKEGHYFPLILQKD